MPTCRGLSEKTSCEEMRLKEAAKPACGDFGAAIKLLRNRHQNRPRQLCCFLEPHSFAGDILQKDCRQIGIETSTLICSWRAPLSIQWPWTVYLAGPDLNHMGQYTKIEVLQYSF